MHRLKTIIYIFLIIFVSLNLSAQTSNLKHISKSDSLNSLNYDPNQYILLTDSIINFSKKYLGTPYRGGGKGPNSFDCSGFTSFVFNNFGIKLGSSSADQAENLPSICENEIQPGDLVFYNGRARGHRVGHVGMVVSKDENGNFNFIHSASSVGISISSSTSDYYRKRFVKAGRILSQDSLLARTFTLPANNLATITPSIDITPEQTNTNLSYKIITKTKSIPAKFHTVKSGETLSEIAMKYGTSISQLKKQNKLNGDFLSLKQRIKITESKKIDVEEKVLVATSENPDNNQANIITKNNVNDTHTIKKGETLFSISKQYGIRVSEIERINKLENAKVYPGQVIKLKDDIQTEKLLTEELKTNESNEKITAKVDSKKSASLQTKSHTVKKGESLSEIAEKYNCTVREIKSWNAKKNNNINAGEKLKIKIMNS